METIQIEREFIKNIENQEAQYWSDYYSYCKSPLQDKLGVSISVVKGAVCCTVPATDRLAFNRTIGIGLDYEICDEQLQEIIQFYKKNKEMVEGHRNEKILLRNCFVHHNKWAKLFKRLTEKVKIPQTLFSVEVMDLSNIDEFDRVIKVAFEFDYDTHLLISRTYKKPGWKHYLIKDGNKAIAAGSLFVCGEFASFAIAGTIPSARGKGAQKLLIAKRLNDAFEAGCKYAVVETSEDKPENPSQSYRNILKAGFETAYLRPNYLYNFNQQ